MERKSLSKVFKRLGGLKMTENKTEKKNEIIIEKLSNVLEELEFLIQNCPCIVGLGNYPTACIDGFDCTECWIKALRANERGV